MSVVDNEGSRHSCPVSSTQTAWSEPRGPPVHATPFSDQSSALASSIDHVVERSEDHSDHHEITLLNFE